MNTQSDKLVTDFKTLINDTEELVKATTVQTGDKIAEICNRAQQAAIKIKPQLVELQTKVVNNAKATIAATEHYVQDHPWVTISVCTGVGVLLGLLISRR